MSALVALVMAVSVYVQFSWTGLAFCVGGLAWTVGCIHFGMKQGCRATLIGVIPLGPAGFLLPSL